MNEGFWHGRRVFLTGHTGFKGSWLAIWLQRLGADVTGFALAPPPGPSLFESANVSTGMTSVIGDVRDVDALRAALEAAQPEIVLHMAAQALVRRSYVDPIETYATNVMGTVHLLDAVRRLPTVRAVVNVTSDKCYENREWAWGYRECERMGGHDPYSNSKGCSELLTASFRNSFFSRAAAHVALGSARAGNVIGGGDWAEDRLVPDILRAISEGRSVSIRNPHAIRPWQHVLEPLSGYMTLAEALYERKAGAADGWNFGPADADAKPVGWIVQRLTELWGEGAAWSLDTAEHPHEAHYLKLDCSKAHGQLGWHPRWSLDEALAKIVEWQRAYMHGANMRDTTERQIDVYRTT